MQRNSSRKSFARTAYAKALPFLLEDFGYRCAYSLVHHRQESKGLEVDHFDPRLKGQAIQRYENLMPSTRLCNSLKGNHWPTPQEREEGIRFLDPSKEQDYDYQIFEDPATHCLVGTTVAAKYHIRVLGLNSPFFVRQRADRAKFHAFMKMPGIMHGVEQVEAVKKKFDEMIPPIKSPP